MSECGGCDGMGSHKRHCRQNPTYSPRLELADELNSQGDRASGFSTDAANLIWRAESILRGVDR